MKRRPMTRYIVCAAFAGLILSGAVVSGFYKFTGRAGVRESEAIGLPESRNSIRHAYAAAEAYAILRTLGLPERLAEKVVIKLGYLNELFEHYSKRHKDSTSEVYKDLFNNAGGITAARWLENCPRAHAELTRLDVIKSLAARQALPFLSSDQRLPPLPAGTDYRAAIRKFKIDKAAIVDDVQIRLRGAVGACSNDHSQGI